MNRLKSTLLVMCATVIVAASVLAIAPISGAESASLGYPPRKDYVVEPGKTTNDTLTIHNKDRAAPLNLTFRVVDFTFNDDSGTPKLMLEQDAPQTVESLKPFLTVPESVTIEPNSSQTLDMSVSIPATQGAGSYYSAIIYSSGTADGGNVGLSASGVTLVFTEVPGEVSERLILEKLGAYDQGASKYKYFNGEMPQRIGYTIKNEGNVTGRPAGSITLRHIFGRETVIHNINPSSSLALIGQSRTFAPCIALKSQEVNFAGTRAEATACAQPDLWPGYYTVELSAMYGRSGNLTQDLEGTASFWYLPWWFVFLSLAVLAFIGYHIWKIVRHIRRRRSGVQLKRRPTRRR